MKIIAHRGNLSGPSPSQDNKPYIIDVALINGFDVEVDVWYVNGALFLGHDKPKYLMLPRYLVDSRIWFHCKNIEAFDWFRRHTPSVKFFWHQEDDYTMVQGIQKIWVYPGKPTPPDSIFVHIPGYELPDNVLDLYGICTDYPRDMKERIKDYK